MRRIIDSARNHYDDGWGALYDVTEDSELLDRVGGSDSDPDREWRINLGDFYHEEEDVTRNCKIDGEDWTKTVGPKKYKKTKIWHCGPSSWLKLVLFNLWTSLSEKHTTRERSIAGIGAHKLKAINCWS